jgi:hypothetical protein
MINQEDKRGSPRRRLLKGGIITFNDRRSTLSCTVRDLSATGAHLGVHSIVAPDRFILIIELDGMEADCEVVRRTGKDLRVKFSSPPRWRKAIRSQVIKRSER